MGNQTAIDFQGIYETERNAYQGSVGSGTTLTTIDTCYNTTTAPPCTGTAVTLPISARRVWTTLKGQNGSPDMKREAVTDYDSFGYPTEVDEYGYSSNFLRKTLMSYQIFNSVQAGVTCNPLTQGNVCFEEPSQIQVYDEASGEVLNAQTNYTYSNTTTASSNTPQHVAPTGDRANAAQVTNSVATGSALSQSSTFYDTGMLSTATDVNNNLTTYNYPNATSTCGNAFPTSVTLPINYANPPSTTWDCNGTVPLSSTDVNNQTSTYTYYDPFWRLTKVVDPTAATTTISYGDVSGGFNRASTLTFNGGASTVDLLTLYDGIGRPIVSQRRQAPGSTNYDSVQTTYDSLGRVHSVSMPYDETAEQGAPSGTAFTTYTYDALSRPSVITDGGGGTVTYTYNERDVYKTVGPAPSGEHTKSWQYEYDALGNLLSVCEITSMLGGHGTCSQTATQTGLFTSYGDNALGQLISVTQDAQSSAPQTRSYSYDLFGRMTEETNPESGTTYYAYDSDPACGTTPYYGDLVKKKDAAGNVTCYTYDALHRVTSQTQPGGPTLPRYYVYDGATVNGAAVPYAEGRLAEACTGGTGACGGSLTTALGFGYSPRGEPTDTYTWTNQSNGW